MSKYYGSLTNRLEGYAVQPKIEVGMGATELMYSDCYPFTVIEVSKSGKRAKVQEDIAIRTDNNGMSDCQDYEYKQDPTGRIVEIRMNKYGRWVQVKSSTQFGLGYRRKYHDYSF